MEANDFSKAEQFEFFLHSIDMNSPSADKRLYALYSQTVTLLERITDAFIAVDTSWRYVYVNKRAEEMLGYTRAQLIGKSIWEVFPASLNTHVEQFFRSVIETQQADQIEFLSPSLHIWLQAHIYPSPNGLSIYLLDITERKALEQRKDDFISITGHELKTPITTIKGYTQLLHKILEKQHFQEPLLFLEKMNEQINTLTRLVNDMLDVARMDEEKLEFQLTEIEVDSLLHDIVETFQQMKEQPAPTHHRLVLHGKTHEKIVGDPNRLRQVFINLINNAIKYSPNANIVELNIEKQHENIIVSVRDYGIGIPKEHQSHIFERFYRIYDMQHKGIQGLGIGLYISAELVQRHNGKIWIESEVGKGTTFYVSLPLIYKPQPQTPPVV